MSCLYHAHIGDEPCPWCAEAAGHIAGAGDDAWRNEPQCPHCDARDMRRNEFAGYSWCGACGRRRDAEAVAT